MDELHNTFCCVYVLFFLKFVLLPSTMYYLYLEQQRDFFMRFFWFDVGYWPLTLQSWTCGWKLCTFLSNSCPNFLSHGHFSLLDTWISSHVSPCSSSSVQSSVITDMLPCSVPWVQHSILFSMFTICGLVFSALLSIAGHHSFVCQEEGRGVQL